MCRTYACVRDGCGRYTYLVIGSGSLLCRESQRYSLVCVCVEAFVFGGGMHVNTHVICIKRPNVPTPPI
jgi:hypothetical protein